MGVFAPPSPYFKNVSCVREIEILVEQQPPQGVLECDHAGLVINKFSRGVPAAKHDRGLVEEVARVARVAQVLVVRRPAVGYHGLSRCRSFTKPLRSPLCG